MIDVLEIEIKEFKDSIYDEYTRLFPENEQRKWNSIKVTYSNGIEKFYKVIVDNKTIGFIMCERLKDDYPYYLDYFAIFEKYQNLGYGTEAIKVLLNKIATKNGLIAEIEKEYKDNPITIKRWEFYRRLGFKKIESEYLLYNVFYTPIVYRKYNDIDKAEYDKIFFDYYKINCRRK